MATLTTEQLLRQNETKDPNTITTLTLTHKALSHVSCLADFKNLEKLDLSSNNLSSLEGLNSCFNLKWLSVLQNKLESLKGIEGLAKLTVLNAGKNKLRSMDEVRSLFSLRALILNDNEIVSICKLDEIKELNTLVLSRNPIQEIGNSLAKVKSITKLSLAKCQLQSIGSSLVACVELKEVRLSHNDIKILPGELAQNTRIQNLDVGNNLITSSSDLKVLSSLHNLRNLNLQGNPVAENTKITEKIKKLVPNLQIFNAKPLDKISKNEKRGRDGDSLLNVGTEFEATKEEKKDHSIGNKRSKHRDETKEENPKRKDLVREDMKKEMNLRVKQGEVMGKERKPKKSKRGEIDVIDDGETPFMELFATDAIEDKEEDGAFEGVDPNGALVTHKTKREKTKSLVVWPTDEIGLGGPSTWDDE